MSLWTPLSNSENCIVHTAVASWGNDDSFFTVAVVHMAACVTVVVFSFGSSWQANDHHPTNPLALQYSLTHTYVNTFSLGYTV